MRWKKYPSGEIDPWTRWFAWCPVEIGSVEDNAKKRPGDIEIVWLEYVERKRITTSMKGIKIYEHRKIN